LRLKDAKSRFSQGLTNRFGLKSQQWTPTV
jgi:hypothetical protein